MNGDGKADMMYHGSGNEFWYYQSNGTTFDAGVKVMDFAGSFVEGSAGYGDINGDGLGDIIFQDASNDFYISLSSDDWVTTLLELKRKQQ